jgi:hypothetical protein
MKKWQRETKNELNSILLRVGMVKDQPELFQDIYDSDGHIVPIENLSRANELSGAGLEYLTSIADYIYTHYKKNINHNNSNLYDEFPYLEWGAALKIASGGIAGQTERIERTIMQYIAKPKMVFMIDKDDHLHTRWPFILDFDWGGPGKLDAKQAIRLSNLNKTKGNKAEKEDGLPRLPIQGVTIMAAKPLFEQFFIRGSTYSFPTGMYAKMYHNAMLLRKSFAKNGLGDDPLIDTDTHISAYTRYARYIMSHNNLTPIQSKDKKYDDTIELPAIKFVKSVYPSLLSRNGRKEEHIENAKFSRFMTYAEIIMHAIDNFNIYPTLEGLRKGKIVFRLFTDRQRALQHHFEVVDRMNKKGDSFL